MEWFGTSSRRLIMKLSLSVQLTDDLTGLPIRGSNARVWIDGVKPPIRKNDGRYIFTNLEEGEYLLRAEGGTYTYTEHLCSVADGKMETVTLRLLPNRVYPLPSDAVHIEGKAAPGSVIRMYSFDKATAYKLLSDAKKGSDVIGIYHGQAVNIEGKLFKILSSDGTGEYIRVAAKENKDKSEYRLSDKLQADRMKLGTFIVPASECIADANGDFLLLTKNTTETMCDVITDGKSVQKKVELSGSKFITLDLTK